MASPWILSLNRRQHPQSLFPCTILQAAPQFSGLVVLWNRVRLRGWWGSEERLTPFALILNVHQPPTMFIVASATKNVHNACVRCERGSGMMQAWGGERGVNMLRRPQGQH